MSSNPENTAPASSTALRVGSLTKAYRIWRDPAARFRGLVLETLAHVLPFARGVFERRAQPLYHDFFALDGVSIELRRGESVGVIGRNGSGKSTLLQLVTGTLQPTSGAVELNGRVAALLELGSGFNPEFTGRENVYLNAAILGLTKAQTDAKFDEIAAFADIGEFLEQPVKTYSSGMMVRLAFAVQVAVEPDILIVDEALAVGDMRFSMKCIRRMEELKARGTSLMLVSHDLSTIVNLCDRVFWLHDGKVLRHGEPRRIALEYSNFMSYGLMPAANEEGKAVQAELPRSRPAGAAAGTPAGRVSLAPAPQGLHWVACDDIPWTGAGGARVRRIALRRSGLSGNATLFEGGEDLEIFLDVEATETLEAPSFCSDLFDRKGNLLFGLNTHFLGTKLPRLEAGTRAIVRFACVLPILKSGEYSLSAAISDGTLSSHKQHHILNEAVTLRVHGTRAQQNHHLFTVDATCELLAAHD